MLFGLQVMAQEANSDFGFQYPDDLFVWGGLIVCAMAGILTYRIYSFIVNPEYPPRKIPLYAVSTGAALVYIDFSVASLFLAPYWHWFAYMGPFFKLFYVLLVLSIIDTIPFWMAINRRT